MAFVSALASLASRLLRNSLSVCRVLDENYFVAGNYKTGTILFLACLIVVLALDLLPELLQFKVKPRFFCSIELFEILLVERIVCIRHHEEFDLTLISHCHIFNPNINSDLSFL